MRHIQQIAPCKRLQRRRRNPPETDIAAKKAWRRFNKKDLRKICYKQQLGLCAYTELSLDDEAMGTHLEHIAPRSRYPSRTFEPSNIVLCAMDDVFAGTLPDAERFGGHYKLNQYSEDRFISPLQTDCERYFYYCDKSGQVLPNAELNEQEQENTAHTIALLNLNCAFLIERRQACLVNLKQQLADWRSLNNSTPTEAENIHHSAADTERFITDILAIKNGRLPEFYSAIKQYLQRI